MAKASKCLGISTIVLLIGLIGAGILAVFVIGVIYNSLAIYQYIITEEECPSIFPDLSTNILVLVLGIVSSVHTFGFTTLGTKTTVKLYRKNKENKENEENDKIIMVEESRTAYNISILVLIFIIIWGSFILATKYKEIPMSDQCQQLLSAGASLIWYHLGILISAIGIAISLCCCGCIFITIFSLQK